MQFDQMGKMGRQTAITQAITNNCVCYEEKQFETQGKINRQPAIKQAIIIPIGTNGIMDRQTATSSKWEILRQSRTSFPLYNNEFIAIF